jgi:hypothetical protein
MTHDLATDIRLAIACSFEFPVYKVYIISSRGLGAFQHISFCTATQVSGKLGNGQGLRSPCRKFFLELHEEMLSKNMQNQSST